MGRKRGLFSTGTASGIGAGAGGIFGGIQAADQMKTSAAQRLALAQNAGDNQDKIKLEVAKLMQGQEITDLQTGKKYSAPGVTGLSFGPDGRLIIGSDFNAGVKSVKSAPEVISPLIVHDQETGKFSIGGQEVNPTQIPKSARIVEQSRPPQESKTAAGQLPLLDQMEGIINKQPTGLIGSASSLLSKVTGGAFNPDAKVYNDLKNAAAVGVYRAVTKDTKLSDADAQNRALPMFPDFYDAPDVKAKKFAIIRDAIAAQSAKPGAAAAGGAPPAPATGGPATFANEDEANAAEQAGTLKKGQRVVIGGTPGTWQ